MLRGGDYVAVNTRRVGGRHLPCRIVGEICGRFQLYCSKGILDTTYCHTELTHLTVSFSTIPLDNWRLAPRISMRKTASQELVENCECHNITSESLIVSSSSEEESEVSDLWVYNGAYCSERRLVTSPKGGSLTELSVQLRYFYCSSIPTWLDCNLLFCKMCTHFRSIVGSLSRLCMLETTTGVWYPQWGVRVEWCMCMTVWAQRIWCI